MSQENCFKFNTSNKRKQHEYTQIFEQLGAKLEFTSFDLPEIKASPVEIIVHKASQLDEDIVVEDTSLDVEGVDIGTDIRWFNERLQPYENREAVWRSLLAIRYGDKVEVFSGEVHGTLVAPREIDKTSREAAGVFGTADPTAWGFDQCFLPDGAEHTLMQSRPIKMNPRYLAAKALMEKAPFEIRDLITNWTGEWQDEH
eukprot:TRINITY_DN62909_c0_g1_i1.p1 TRINITY_DN62909_c0_g1~~TRINITY_DN62909_c0_g1_i1.p1  ORF type:complete len:220 (-),score=36.70 TRINITY_DN62909_c0_g1_i1:422-1021(-)